MARITELQERNTKEVLYPITNVGAVLDNSGESIENRILPAAGAKNTVLKTNSAGVIAWESGEVTASDVKFNSSTTLADVMSVDASNVSLGDGTRTTTLMGTTYFDSLQGSPLSVTYSNLKYVISSVDGLTTIQFGSSDNTKPLYFEQQLTNSSNNWYIDTDGNSSFATTATTNLSILEFAGGPETIHISGNQISSVSDLTITAGENDVIIEEVTISGNIIQTDGTGYFNALISSNQNWHINSDGIGYFTSLNLSGNDADLIRGDGTSYAGGSDTLTKAKRYLESTVTQTLELPTNGPRKFFAFLSNNADFSLASPPSTTELGFELHLVVYNNSENTITIAIPKNTQYVPDRETLSIAPKSYAEIDVINDGTAFIIRTLL